MLDEKTIKKIREDFPEESVQVKKTFKHPETGEEQVLTGYKPQYVFERLNDAFGHDGWSYEIINHGIEGKDAWVWGRLTLYEVMRDKNNPLGPFVQVVMSTIDQFGTGSYNKATPLGDAMKGAATNALEKCASLKDIGGKAYKGLQEVPDSYPEAQKLNQSKSTSDYSKARKSLLDLCRKYKVNKQSFPTLSETVLKEKKEIEDMSAEEIKSLVDYLEKNKSPF